ncbi:1-phosphofructokinase [Facklamia sp. DSM 111018]|uniref:Tagatose-6-phosphate kinase n=1 Tax=Facklamia lactis TaxID=2749967 RepID=A0ABS0LRS9_9LACT|nr:1-phosphofructokinase [Facklamia lactis]MBG9981069.1 1-phosphofructokinase [Facklamia lactis]MBG9986870.1 1-phosphofructokinase [Facklamia lactis]
MKIYTCTLNLAIDLFIETDEMVPLKVNRTIDDDIQANGKGINVSLVLNKLGYQSTALGFKAGFTGQFIEDEINQEGIQSNFIEVPGNTRINVFTKVNNEGKEYKLVNKGPFVPQKAIRSLLEQIEQIEPGSYLCLSGSFPRGVKPSLLIEISEICYQRNINLIIDNSSAEVIETLPFKPFLVKPNEEEIYEWLGKAIGSIDDARQQAQKLAELGAQHVLLSLGAKGCVYASKEKTLFGNSPKGKVINTACSGDTLLATFLANYLSHKSLKDALRESIAAGSSTAFRQGLTDFSDVEELKKQIKIK